MATLSRNIGERNLGFVNVIALLSVRETRLGRGRLDQTQQNGAPDAMVPPKSRSIASTSGKPTASWLTAGIAGFCALLIGTFWLSVEYLIRQEHETRRAEIIRQNTNLVRAFEEHTARTLDYVDEVAQQLVRRVERGDMPRESIELFRGLNTRIVAGVGIADAAGTLVLSHPSGAARISIADRAHFLVHREGRLGTMFLSDPARSRGTGDWTIFASRRIDAADGGFRGVVSIALDPYYFTNFYREIDLGADPIVGLTNDRGIVLARLPDYGGTLGVDVSKTEIFRNFLTGTPGANFVARSVSDGKERIWVSRFVRSHPLIVSIGVSGTAEFVETEKRAANYRIFAGAGTLLVGLFFCGYLLHQRRSALAERQRQADVRLRQSFVDLSAIIAWMKDEDGRYVFVSDNFLKRNGFASTDVIGKTDFDIWPKEAAERLVANDRKTAKDGKKNEYIEKGISKEKGESWWFKHKFVYVDAADRRFVGGVGVDVTEQVKADSRLRASETLLETIINSSPDWIFAKDLAHRMLLCNVAFAAVQNKNPAELLGKDDRETWWSAPGETDPSAAIEKVWQLDRLVFAGETVRLPRHERLLPDGSKRWTDTIKAPLKDASGQITGLVGYSRDITDIVRADASLRLFMTIVEQSPVSVMVTDTAGAIEYVNPTFCDVTGYDFDEAIGQNPRLLKSDQTDPEIYRELWQAIKRGDTWRGELLNRTKSGTTIWERVVVSPLTDENGDIVRFVAVHENITRAKAAQADLIEAKERAEAANRAKSTFLAMMSHELRTPLNAIIGFSEMLRHEKLGPIGRPRYREYAADIENSGRHLLEVLNEVLDIAKFETGNFKTEIHRFSLAKIVSNVAPILNALATEHGHDLTIKTEGAGVALCDQRAVRQILLNLVSNSAKYTRRGGKIEIGVVERPDGGAELWVADNGIGMAREDIERSTELFTRLDHRLDRLPEGVGIGLYMVKRLVENMGATFTIASELGVGTKVTVAFSRAFEKAA